MTRSIMRLWLFATIVLGGAVSSAFAAPAYRIEDAMVYDPIGRRHIMFGGFDSQSESLPGTRFNDIWEYDGAMRTWYNVTPSGGDMPVPRSGHAFAFDPTRRVVVLFGGWNPTHGYLSDTWEWNCAARTWTHISTLTAPSARQGPRMTYDAAGNQLILFGGVDANHFYNDTWRYSAGIWTRVTTTANSSSNRTFNGRTYHGLVYNSARGNLLIFGGIGYPNGATEGVVTDFDDMWELVGTTWTDITPSGTKPNGRGWFGMTYETATNRVVVYGGWNNTSRFTYADTWAWNGSTWSQIAANSAPGPRDSFAMTYDTARSRSVVFGGYWSDLWELGGSTWISVTTTDRVGLPPAPHPLVRSDFDGDAKTDIAIFRPSTGAWYFGLSGTATTNSVSWGGAGDVPVAGDYDGDGKSDIGVFRPGTGRWYLVMSSTESSVTGTWGGNGDVAVPADYDGDGRTDVAVFRPSTGTWYIVSSATGTSWAPVWGGVSDIPVPGDYDGDGRTDIGVFRPSTGVWYLVRSSTGSSFTVTWGGGNDVPVARDYDGDGMTDIAIFRPSTSTWFLTYSRSRTSASFAWGGSGDIPVSADYDGDGKADIAVFRPSNGTWYVVRSLTGTTWNVVWGGLGDMPLPAKP